MIRILAKLFAVGAVLTICLHIQPSSAENVAFVSAAGSGTACTQTAPCGSILQAVISVGGDGRIVCLTPVSETANIGLSTGTYIFDCPSASMHGRLSMSPFGNAVLKFQHMSFSPGSNSVNAGGGGTLILEDCVIEDAQAIGLDIEPNGPLNLVITNSRISNNAGTGVLIKPASGGNVIATFDGVTITKNAGGLHTDTTNGAVKVDISNSTISNNGNNGMAVVGGAGGQNMVSVTSDVIASNSQAGIEASGANAAVVVNNTLLDSNTLGALSAVSGGRILTYQNNNIIGSPGTGFTGTAAPQ